MNIRNKRLLWIVELVLMICLLLTYGRGALLSLGFAILLITLFYIRKKKLLFFCIPGMILVILCFYMSGESFLNIGERFQDVKVWESVPLRFPCFQKTLTSKQDPASILKDFLHLL
jgi:hypothetical protein